VVVGNRYADHDDDGGHDEKRDEESRRPRLLWLLVFGGRDHHRGFVTG